MKRNIQNKGITLIALVITIIVLLILAGTSIAMLTGENALLNKATNANVQTKDMTSKEKIKLAVISSIGTDGKISIEQLKKEIQKQGGILNTETYPIKVEVDSIEYIINSKGEVLNAPDMSVSAYAMIYDDGTMVLQRGNEIDKSKNILASYTDFENIIPETKEDLPWYSDGYSPFILKVEFKDIIKPISLKNWFEGMTSCTSIDLSMLDMSRCTSMCATFYSCSSLTTIIGISELDTSNVTDMRFMFQKCESLVTIDISKWNTKNVTVAGQMFAQCKLLSKVDLSNWNTEKFEYAWGLFYQCESLESIGDISKWDTRNIIEVGSMFNDCISLSTVGDLSDWNIESLISTRDMFYNCPAKPIPSWYNGDYGLQ